MSSVTTRSTPLASGRSIPAAIVFSPGPCTPNEAGEALDIARELHHDYPMLGVLPRSPDSGSPRWARELSVRHSQCTDALR